MTEAPLQVWRERDGRLLRLRLNRPKANIVDAEMIAALDAAFAGLAENRDAQAVVLDHAGPHFSFGASVEEHLPDRCAEMLASLHALIKKMLGAPVPILVAVKGQCLGGGLEVAMAAGADPGRGQGPVPGRRPRGRHGRAHDLRRPRRHARAAGDQAGRLRAGGELPAAPARRPPARRGPALFGA
jgi:hypothetical protein